MAIVTNAKNDMRMGAADLGPHCLYGQMATRWRHGRVRILDQFDDGGGQLLLVRIDNERVVGHRDVHGNRGQ